MGFAWAPLRTKSQMQSLCTELLEMVTCYLPPLEAYGTLSKISRRLRTFMLRRQINVIILMDATDRSFRFHAVDKDWLWNDPHYLCVVTWSVEGFPGDQSAKWEGMIADAIASVIPPCWNVHWTVLLSGATPKHLMFIRACPERVVAFDLTWCPEPLGSSGCTEVLGQMKSPHVKEVYWNHRWPGSVRLIDCFPNLQKIYIDQHSRADSLDFLEGSPSDVTVEAFTRVIWSGVPRERMAKVNHLNLQYYTPVGDVKELLPVKGKLHGRLNVSVRDCYEIGLLVTPDCLSDAHELSVCFELRDERLLTSSNWGAQVGKQIVQKYRHLRILRVDGDSHSDTAFASYVAQTVKAMSPSIHVFANDCKL